MTRTETRVRAVDTGADDRAAVAALLAAYHARTEAEKVAHGLQAEGPLAPAYAAEIADPAAAFAGSSVLIAERGDEALGMAVLRVPPGVAGMDEGAAAGDAAGDAEIKRLWVDPGARGAGVGSALLADAATRARAVGAASLRLSVWDWRDDAIGLYRARGFQVAPSWESRERLVCLRLPL
ncbi:GNAT family N-acetyltransferase [Microbacterium sp. NPDC089189]|uniref:GNAT family N-acetyltransferase n=1 Tax=Microbacterium sp. NPDC089189 TaxID=3154972 RepID=UPI00343E2591